MIEAIIKGFGLGLILAVSVGPVIFTIIKQSINNGHKGGFSFVTGVWISDIVWVVLSNLFSSLVIDLLAFKTEIGYVGAVLMIAELVSTKPKSMTVVSGYNSLSL